MRVRTLTKSRDNLNNLLLRRRKEKDIWSFDLNTEIKNILLLNQNYESSSSVIIDESLESSSFIESSD